MCHQIWIFLGAEVSLNTFILQVVEEPYLEALKEQYIGYGRRISLEMIAHLNTKICKVTNKDKVQLQKEVFINWEQLQVLSAYFKKIKNARKQLQKWIVNVSDNDIAIYIADQMYKSDWFLEDTMTEWKEKNDNRKAWKQY